MARRLFIFGIGSFAEMVHYLYTTDSGYEVAGFTVDGAYLDRSTFMGLPVVPYEELRASADRDAVDLYVAIGVGRMNTARAEKVAAVSADGFRLASFLSSQAHVPQGFVVHPNTMIMDQVNIHPWVEVGANTVLWSNTRVALKSSIGSHCWVMSAVMAHGAVIGDYSLVGLNATVGPGVTIGKHNLIGTGAVIVRDTKDYEVYKGPRSTPSTVSSLRIQNMTMIH